ncbi:DMT family transporter [Vibrio sp. ZSDE26]|uniref:DMT family transporter n=1 Tax=Vibrio amylolyticus TaxID=2847292 RepID=A0A9X1XK52_9VIBR|nr:DMT family transporter [Vibrio amylolyticus]MCK6264211.1 DMT family transporter [Vibrio amylolyticus]
MPTEDKAALLMLCSTLSLSLTGLVAKFLTSEFSLLTLLFLRLFIPAVLMLSVVASIKIVLPKKNLMKPILTRSVCVVGCQICFLTSLTQLTLVESVVLFATGPLFIPVLEKLFFGTAIKRVVKVALTVTFIGVILMTSDGSSIHFKPEMLIGLGAGMFNAGSQLSLYRSSKGDMSASATNGWSFLFSSLLVLPISLWYGLSDADRVILAAPIESWVSWLALLVLALVTMSNQIFRSKAYKLAESNSQLAPLIFTHLLFTLVWQLTFFDAEVTQEKVLGVVLIVVASLMQTFISKREKIPKLKLKSCR